LYRSILERELESWKEGFASKLAKEDRDLFNQMLQSAYKHSSSIEAKGENYSTQSLLMSLLLEQHKRIMNENISS
jgi:hypothetical protein